MQVVHNVKATFVRSIGRVHIVKLVLSPKQKDFWKANVNPDYLNEDEKGTITTVIAKSIMPFIPLTKPVDYSFGLNKDGNFFSGPVDTSSTVSEEMEALVNAEKAKLIAQAQLGLLQLPGTRTRSAAPKTTTTPADIASDNDEIKSILDQAKADANAEAANVPNAEPAAEEQQ